MIKYAAMIRGIGPGNPNMHSEKLKWAFESLGFTNVRTVITSGNVIFETASTDSAKLERLVEEALPRLLGFDRAVFIRSQAELQTLVDADPFPGIKQGPEHYITVTFLKSTPALAPALPHKPQGKEFEILALYDRAITATLDQTNEQTPSMMSWLEKQFGENITTRTWKTINRLLAKMNS
jgi:uncharacterized protein (DUF1697 family)